MKNLYGEPIYKHFYAGIGSRRTPVELLNTLEEVGTFMDEWGYQLRTGGAYGADMAFEKGCIKNNGIPIVYLPWKGYNDRWTDSIGANQYSLEMAEQFHPAWGKCSNGAKRLLARNCTIIMGHFLNDPVDLVVCWTPGKGGTEHALRVARANKIPVFNLFYPTAFNELVAYVRRYA